MTGYFLVELAMRDGAPHVAGQYDRIFYVAEDGTRSDISEAITAHRIESKVGDARRLVLDVFRFDIARTDAP